MSIHKILFKYNKSPLDIFNTRKHFGDYVKGKVVTLLTFFLQWFFSLFTWANENYCALHKNRQIRIES